jgi:YbbR domain-containing protein
MCPVENYYFHNTFRNLQRKNGKLDLTLQQTNKKMNKNNKPYFHINLREKVQIKFQCQTCFCVTNFQLNLAIILAIQNFS